VDTVLVNSTKESIRALAAAARRLLNEFAAVIFRFLLEWFGGCSADAKSVAGAVPNWKNPAKPSIRLRDTLCNTDEFLMNGNFSQFSGSAFFMAVSQCRG